MKNAAIGTFFSEWLDFLVPKSTVPGRTAPDSVLIGEEASIPDSLLSEVLTFGIPERQPSK